MCGPIENKNCWKACINEYSSEFFGDNSSITNLACQLHNPDRYRDHTLALKADCTLVDEAAVSSNVFWWTTVLKPSLSVPSTLTCVFVPSLYKNGSTKEAKFLPSAIAVMLFEGLSTKRAARATPMPVLKHWFIKRAMNWRQKLTTRRAWKYSIVSKALGCFNLSVKSSWVLYRDMFSGPETTTCRYAAAMTLNRARFQWAKAGQKKWFT